MGELWSLSWIQFFPIFLQLSPCSNSDFWSNDRIIFDRISHFYAVIDSYRKYVLRVYHSLHNHLPLLIQLDLLELELFHMSDWLLGDLLKYGLSPLWPFLVMCLIFDIWQNQRQYGVNAWHISCSSPWSLYHVQFWLRVSAISIYTIIHQLFQDLHRLFYHMKIQFVEDHKSMA